MGARYCPRCDVPWPSEEEGPDREPLYKTCPLCDKATKFRTRKNSLSPEEAREFAFEVYYRRREEERIKRGDPAPEELETL